MKRHLLLLPTCIACADVTPIDDGAVYGSTTVVKDWFTSAALVETSDGPVMVDAGFREGRMGRALDDLGA